MVSGIAAFSLCALLLPTMARGVSKTYFTETEVNPVVVNPGIWITVGQKMFFTDRSYTADENASDPRLSGKGTIWANGVVEPATGKTTIWGRFRLENEGGAWEGYWRGINGAAQMTAAGSGDYAGLLTRWTFAGADASGSHWEGYIIENGPGEVPLKISGWRVEQFQWMPGVVMGTEQPVLLGQVTLVKGAGLASHAGVIRDAMELGLVTFLDETTVASTAIGTMKAANGDLLHWVAFGRTDLQTGVADVTVHFAGGTGRFEAAYGSFEVDITEQIDPATGIGTYWYDATGTIGY